MFECVLQAIKDYDTIIIHRHCYPDGDAIGSQVGLATLIRDNFADKQVYCVGDQAKRIPFMKGSTMDVIDDQCYNGALAIILDCGAAKMICDDRYKLASMKIRIDHHLKCEDFGDIDIVDSTYESCCGMLAMFAKECGLKLSPLSAESLYTGMVTDSGRFAFDSTSSRTFELAAFLLSQKFDIQSLYYNLYAEDFDKLIEKANNMYKIKFTEHNVAYIYTAMEDMVGIDDSEHIVSTGMISLMKDIKGVYIWANFTESTDGVHVEIRSNKYNINPVATKYGGGGHKKASGATVADKQTAFALLNDLDLLATTSD